jgi:hypothetical protein
MELLDGACSKNTDVSDCRKCCIIYEAECKLCNMVYRGTTQNKNKKRQNQHFGDVKKLVEDGIKSDSFAEHFAKHFKEQGIKKASNSMVRAMVKMKIIWKGNIISCMKSFNKRTCKLCMKERMLILEGMEENPKKLINTRAEIYGGCKHKTAFHRFKNIYTPVEQSSTDDGISQKESITKRSNQKAKVNPYEEWWLKVGIEDIMIDGVVVCPSVLSVPVENEPPQLAEEPAVIFDV